ncbi:MAG TPA: hypothetical protein VNX27_05485 [Chthoniobacterales bacterium]|jgi:hypothetical protein|nr:hypothetical protein [Chthoniobacterales bacterium]
MQLRGFTVVYAFMKLRWALVGLGFVTGSAFAQIQVELKFPRLQYIAYEPVVANLTITNLAGRDVDLRDNPSQPWFGFEVSDNEGRSIPQISKAATESLSIGAGQRVTRKVNLTPLYGVHDFGAYRVRAHIYFGDVNKFFYSATRVFEITNARPIWQKTVGVPQESGASGSARTYSLMTNRFPDHTSLYVRVEDKDRGMVYATYSLGQIIAFDQPQAEFDHSNQLHVLYCAAPRMWSYARVGLNGELVSRASFAETKSRPRLVHSDDGVIRVAGGMMNTSVTQAARDTQLSARPPKGPNED